MENKDVIGTALLAYLKGARGEEIKVVSNIAEDDVIPVDYLCRTAKALPKIEAKALELCKGSVLDVGAGSGAHTLILQQKGLTVKAIDISEGAVAAMQQQGIKNATQCDFFKLENEQFDTLLFLMNGVGIAQTLEGLRVFLLKAKKLLNVRGQILLDSTDIHYFFEEEDGSVWMNLNGPYYGEVTYQMEYNNHKTDEFSWLFVDFEKLTEVASTLGFNCELILENENNAYLAKLTFK